MASKKKEELLQPEVQTQAQPAAQSTYSAEGLNSRADVEKAMANVSYRPGQQVTDAADALKQWQQNRPADYQSSYQDKINSLLGQLLDSDEGARSIGEVALVPASSPINRSGALFYSTLFDENAACHIAFGASYPGTTKGGTALTKEQLEARGMNQSRLHEDVMIGAEDSHITGKCRDGRTVQLFENGVWVL